MKRKVIPICGAVLLFLLAAAVLLYPLISSAYNEKHQSELLTTYTEEIKQVDKTALIAARQQAEDYNQALVPGSREMDAFSEEAILAASKEYRNLLDLSGSGIMGYVEIPAIDVYLPIYHGTDDFTLEVGIGHLLGSSLPVGGESTHAILTGHSGMASRRMFTDLPQLSLGDVFYLHILDEVLAYQVYYTVEVLPHDTSKLQIVQGEDICTLVTCTPIGINTHRLLVTGERIPYVEAEEIVQEQIQKAEPQGSVWEENYLKGILIGLVCVMSIALLIVVIALFRRCRSLKVRIFLVVLMSVIFLAGASVFAFPHIQGAMVEKQMEKQASSFLEQTVQDRVPEPIEPTETGVPAETTPTEEIVPTEAPAEREYEVLWEAMVSYNETLWLDKQAGLCDPWAYIQPSFTLGDFGLEDEVFGVISIPKIKLSMPIYLGATDAHLAAGAAQLSQTSLPIGGTNTNCVLSGHRGYNGAAFFRYVPDLQPGDTVIITNLWETLTYTVRYTDIIEPYEVEKILIREGKDMITLLTCHPYASGGKQRYVVYCERVS